MAKYAKAVDSGIDFLPLSNERKNKYYNKDGKVKKITIHHMAGIMKASDCALMHKRGGKSSANYYIGKEGEILVGVPEDRRAWTSSSRENDYQAITIEVSNNMTRSPWGVDNRVMETLIDLCTDLCKRYNIAPQYDGTPNASFTEHRMFANTLCPGEYLHLNMSNIANQVTERLWQGIQTEVKTYTVKKGDNLTKIAAKHQMSVSDLIMLNPAIKDPNKIYPGEVLTISW